MKLYTGVRAYQEHEIGGGEECRGDCFIKVFEAWDKSVSGK